MRICELKEKEVINVCSGKRLGCIADVEINICTGEIEAIVIPGPGKICGFFGTDCEYVIPFSCIKKIGPDIVLVEIKEEKFCKNFKACGIIIAHIENGKRKAEMLMRCPYCGNPDTRVIDSRPAEDKNSIRRRRSCDECGRRFTTYEKVETIPLIVIKKDNNREQYERSKIEQGVLSACYKRPVPAEAIQKTIDAVELEIFNREEKEIPSSEIGEIVMEKLKELDPVAYVRFASVYREFKDAGTFMDELKKFLQ